ncbi:ABC transporter ATP-binding protein [Arthrobacter sp. H14-L1]|uniref:ABC transporter ATP-binding protein n=1 Tax=Arthrobacter sp. H14-L1 TaxID=2996697 RepID=UPI00226F9241|nr:ATP-binding cassette domain-containing protein [Arthrobacter sp. H14-L1]MCY0905839.1 ATP-binding cassette domain-containing protein [Arthrobacter sp. H14-L1]
MIVDEPTSALDVTVQRQILNQLQTLVDARGTSLLFVTHDLGLAADRTDRIIVMSEGRIVEVGIPAQILLAPREEYTQRLVAAAPSVAATAAGAVAPSSSVPTAALDGGTSEPGAAEPILSVRNLRKEFRLRGQRGSLVTAVDDVSFTVARGTTTAVVGESGSGKTTVARMILGLEDPTGGEALIEGKSITGSNAGDRRGLLRKVQPVFQDPYGSLDPTFSIERLIDEPLRIFKVGGKESRQQRVAELLDQVALPRTVAQRRPNELSGGQRQRVAIARALALEPELTYLFITHDLAVVRQIAHNVVVMKSGKVIENGDVDQVFLAPRDDYTKELLGAIPGAAFAS